jgi:dipeptidyl aminopeptidase/acylaminoacyl peptidase
MRLRTLGLALTLAACGGVSCGTGRVGMGGPPPADTPAAATDKLPLAAPPAPGVPRTERGALVIEGVPEIPPALAERTHQYQQTRAAGLQGWLGDGVLITTRFAETSQVHLVAAPGGARQQLTFFAEPVAGAAPAPDGRRFLFPKDIGGNEYYQVYRFDLASGEHRMLTDGASRNENPLWSDDGARFSFSTTRRNGKDTDIHVMAPDADASTPVVEREGHWSALDWSADGRRLLAMKYVSVNESELYVVDVATRELTRFHPASRPIAFGTARFARDGKGVYYTSDEDSEFQHLRFEPLGGGEARVLTADIPWDVEEIEVSADGRYLAFVVNAGGISQLHLRNLKTGRAVATPELPVGLVFGLAFDRPGRRLGFVLNGARSPSDVFSFEVGKRALTRWTRSETGGLDAATFTEPQLVDFPSFDGRRIPAFYYRPAGAGPFPVLINIHGGPEAQSLPAFSPFTEFYVRELGMAVLLPNVRGSAGYGKSYLQLDNGMNRENSVRDIGALLDWIGTRPELDAGRVAVIGGSYGGYMVLASMAHYGERLRAGIDIVGISNFVTFLESTKDYRRDLRRVEYGDERDPVMREFLQRISPTNNAHRIRRPMFVVQGANDPRVPLGEAEQIVAAIRKNGGEAWYLMARDEGHGFAKKANRDYYQNAVVLFLQKFLLGPPAAATPASHGEKGSDQFRSGQ